MGLWSKCGVTDETVSIGFEDSCSVTSWTHFRLLSSKLYFKLKLYLSGQIKIEEINDNLDDYIECGAAAVDDHSGTL